MTDPIPRGPFDQGLFLAHFNKGRDLFEAQRFEEAERQLEEAYLLRPRDARVLNLLGLVYFRGNKLVKAEEVYRKLVAENADAPTLHYNLGLVCFKLNRLEDAEQAFRKALEISEGNPKIHFYLGSIYERLQRYKDAIYQYRQAGANLMVQRVQGKLDTVEKDAGTPRPGSTAPPAPLKLPRDTPEGPPGSSEEAAPPATAEDLPFAGGEKLVRPLSPSLLAEERPRLTSTDRFLRDDTLPPGAKTRPPGASAAPSTQPPAAAEPHQRAETPAGEPGRELFRGIEKGLMEADVCGKVFIKQGTIYSYSGNLTFWVKEKRPGGRTALVIVTGTGRLLLTDHDREITLMQVADEPVFVEPGHLLACEEGLQPRYERLGDEPNAVDLLVLEGKGMVALSVASKPLPLSVKPALPVCVPAPSVIMWTGAITPSVVDDPQVYAVVLPSSSAAGGRLLRLEGTGRVLVEQATGS